MVWYTVDDEVPSGFYKYLCIVQNLMKVITLIFVHYVRHAQRPLACLQGRDYLQGYSVPLPKSKIHHYEILKLYVGENVNRSESNISGAVLVAIPGGYAYSEHKALTDLAASLDRPRRLPILFWLILRS